MSTVLTPGLPVVGDLFGFGFGQEYILPVQAGITYEVKLDLGTLDDAFVSLIDPFGNVDSATISALNGGLTGFGIFGYDVFTPFVSGDYILDVNSVSTPFGDTAGSYFVTYGPTSGIVAMFDQNTGQSLILPSIAVPNSFPVTSEFITVNPDNLDISSNSPGEFISTGDGNDAINASGDFSVLDGGAGSNFLVGTGLDDVFFADDRFTFTDTWDTIAGFHSGDFATIWGVTPQDFALNWVDGLGAPGFTGLTLIATAPGQPTVAVTLSGFSTADLNNGNLSVSFGNSGGNSYMYVHGN